MVAAEKETEILKDIAAGSSKAFRALYSQWEPTLSSFIYQVTRSKVITAEIVQDVFLKIWMTRESLVDVKDFKAYLFVISKNRAINALKKSLADLERMKKYASEVPFNEQPEDEDNDSQLHFSLIDEAIDQLSPRQKEIFLLHRHERYSYREISEQLGIGKESVKTHLSLAIKSIKNHIETKITLIILLIDFISKKSD
jgi:RNA polymerase sigma-70 factor (ECF subfamily)